MNAEITPLIEASPALRAETKKCTSMQMKLRELEAARDKLREEIRTNAGRDDRETLLISEAERIVSGAPAAVRDFTPELVALTRDINTLRQAVEIQARLVDEVRSKEGQRLGSKLTPAYHRRASRVAAALVELGKAQEEEYQYRRDVIDAGYPTHALGGIFFIGHIGRPGDAHSHFNRLLREAEEYGLLNG
jgi:hypothetical protein